MTRMVTVTPVFFLMSSFSLPESVSKSAERMVTAFMLVRCASRAMAQTCPTETGPSSGPTWTQALPFWPWRSVDCSTGSPPKTRIISSR